MKFKIGQEVMVINGVMSGRKGVILSRCASGWYELKIDGLFDRISYLECELEAIH